MTAIVERHDGLVRLEVDGRAVRRLSGAHRAGRARRRRARQRPGARARAGHGRVRRPAREPDARPRPARPRTGAHVMKLPYTPLQHAVLHAEESWGDESLGRPRRPAGRVLLAAQPGRARLRRARAASYGSATSSFRAAPCRCRSPTRCGRFATPRTSRRPWPSGPCFGGEIACVSTASALVACARAGMDAVVCAIGPGIVGTGSRYGHGALAAAEAANAAGSAGRLADPGAARLGSGRAGAPSRALAPHARHARAGAERHRGLAGGPRGAGRARARRDGRCIRLARGVRGLTLSHMGRGPDEEPWFFAAAYAAGLLARARAA